ncbi:hypothetical protein BAUCODRAFT_28794 [Baudoinia panamericana UAMH 10762]|uniref:Enoyl reductase (ER) domain-containing protein n=1 Tax=Baudoinia panamericana (strain UAMH 10762) TaxID=717646 RepID=M2M0B5_BAUPA|nr:uncharacterized protein BAUCODRAFT_28794 [Baudoinia panamericana UAMH 10762]EMD00438.1 hypothetical protein BAUCODRAFT_28794 [Baudoinia panamericana UAMH 10762]
MESSTPTTMRAWQYTDIYATDGLEKHLNLNTVSLPEPKPNQHLVKVLYVCLNPVDYKAAEVPFMSRFFIPKPATPGLDWAGRIVKPAAGSTFKAGDLVFGVSATSPFVGGMLREYATAELNGTVAAPEGVSARDLATLGVASITSSQSILPYVKSGDRIFINGGSGGVGTLGIQLAKQAGCHVTTTCSTPNVELCKSLGADVVIDYTTQDVLEQLKAGGQQYSHIVDNVRSDWNLYWRSAEYTKPGAKFVFIGDTPTPSLIWNVAMANLLPGFLGGAGRTFVMVFAQVANADLERVAMSVRAGTIQPVIDSEFAFEEIEKAIKRQKTGRARGKILINVATET